ncbi:Gag-Pol polyprotein [Gossypium australe]|uniref:Gag-Pol polyprotein n=1 Tax=Gossypium australe TaxID=47621 RepID=A0A5B6WQV3_9ROSI|nr:Gag-Pol polyprotein [Gossypium australe]
MDPDRAVANDVESNAPAPAQGTAPTISRQNENLIRLNKPPVDKIRKYGAEEFRAKIDDDAERAEFWLENTIRVFDEMSLTPNESIKCTVSLLRDTAYNLWKTLISVVLRERITWDFFQTKFRKKYISQRFIDQKRKEFLELKHGRLSVTEYERKFVRIACKAEELDKEKKKADSEVRDERKISMSKFSQPLTKRFRDTCNRSNASFGHLNRDRARLSVGLRTQALIESSVDSVKSNKPKCRQCGRRHVGECWAEYNNRVCYKCGSRDHFIRDCPKMIEEENVQNVRSSNVTAPRNVENVSGS